MRSLLRRERSSDTDRRRRFLDDDLEREGDELLLESDDSEVRGMTFLKDRTEQILPIVEFSTAAMFGTKEEKSKLLSRVHPLAIINEKRQTFST